MVISTHLSTCPNSNCLHQFEWQMGEGAIGGGRLVKHDHGEVQEISIGCTEAGLELIQKYINLQKDTGKKPAWIYFQVLRSPIAPKLSLGDWRYRGQMSNGAETYAKAVPLAG
ncbi:MAG: hypothetical protein ACSI46_18350 [Gloeotrichia echinulata DVL01]